jgi:hypothetical protein
MTSADVQRFESFASTTRANANSSVQPSGLSSSATVRANAAATEGLALYGMESNTGQFSAAISRVGGSGGRSAPGRGTAAGGAVGTCGSGGRARRRRAAESGHASSWCCRGCREGPHVQPGRRGDASEGRAIECIAAEAPRCVSAQRSRWHRA